MKKQKNVWKFLICATALGFALSGCGSSGNRNSNNNAPVAPGSSSVTGVAATGKAIVGDVLLLDSSVPVKTRTAETSEDGSFSLDVNGLQPPFIIRAGWTENGDAKQLFSLADGSGTANINPFANAVFAAAADVSNPASVVTNPDPAVFRAMSGRRGEIKIKLMGELAPLFGLYGTDKDPCNDSYKADHTGLDALFDDVSIKVQSGMIVVMNTETGAMIFTGQVNAIDSGTFYPVNMPGPADGAALYAANCGSCHGPLATSAKRGATAAGISAAISGNAGGMGSLSNLRSLQIQAIARALTSTTPTPVPDDGTALYGSNCSSCHGPLATSSKKGSSASQIQSGISSNMGGMGSLSSLTTAQVQAIADALAVTTPPPSTCTYNYSAWSACQSNGTQTRTMLTASPAGCTGTPVLSQSCTYVPPVTDGAALYATNCSSCHGPLVTSSKKGRTAAQIQSAITNNTGGMGYLSSLTAAQIQAIATALAGTTPPAACTYTYDVWGACQSDNTQTRTMLTSSPAGCTGTPVVSQSCTYVPPAPGTCTYTYSAWGACQSNNTQTRTMLTSSPAGCTGTPLVSQSCTYVPPVSLDGAALYGANCSSCHGSLATSSKKGRTAAQIQSAITNNAGGMGYLSSLTAAQIQAIATALAGTTPPAACTYTYDVWGACQSNNTQTRTMLTSSPAGCTGTPVVSQSCTYVPPAPGACTYTYSAWGACQSNNTQTRTMLTSSPAGCTGTPLVSQSCTYVPPVSLDGAALYGANCSSCHGPLATSAKKGRTAAQIQSAITNNAGGMGYLSSLTAAQIQAIATALAGTTPPAACTYTYNVWGACQSNNTQTRTVLTSSPAGCTGTPIVSQSCTYVPPTPGSCTYTYSVWGACQSNNTQTRTMLTSSPAGCTGTPIVSQSCTYVPPTPIDGAALYASNCSGCHGALATSSKGGRTATQIQSAITSNAGGMGSLASLTTAQIQAIAAALVVTTPPPPPACGSCHAIPPSTGKHIYHQSRATCATCHGTGYSTTAVNASTHQNGVINIASTPGWNATLRTCTNSCHSRKSW